MLNDWSARDLQKMEMAVGLGPAKGKDFATSIGPALVTPDELGDLRLEMVARVNGEERSRGNVADMHWSWDDLVAQAGRNTKLLPGDVLGSGTVGRAASSSTGTAAGSGRATSSSWRSSASASWRTACADDVSRDAEVAVVGSGIAGLATAHSLARRVGRSSCSSSSGSVTSGVEPRRDADLPPCLSGPGLDPFGPGGAHRLAALEVEAAAELLSLVGLVELVRDLSESSQQALAACGVECRVLERLGGRG